MDEKPLVRVTRTWYVPATDAADALAAARPGEHVDVQVEKLNRHPHYRAIDRRISQEGTDR